MNGKNNSKLRGEYVHRINRVMDYIDRNLAGELSLERLAEEAHFSPFHFHRIFRALTGETVNKFINRLRLEKAATSLVLYPQKSITEVALDCGFSGSAPFARAFKEQYGMSAGEWRERGYDEKSKIRKMESKIYNYDGKDGKDVEVKAQYIGGLNHQKIVWSIIMNKPSTLKAEVKVEKLAKMNVAYIRHTGPYAGDEQLFTKLFTKLFTWAGPRGIMAQPDLKVMSVYHDNPDITDEEKLRVSVCVTVPEDTEVEGEVGKMEIPEGDYAIAHFEIKAHQYGDAWDAVYGGWLPESGYQPDDRPCFEIYHNDPNQHPDNLHIVDICMPVKPL